MDENKHDRVDKTDAGECGSEVPCLNQNLLIKSFSTFTCYLHQPVDSSSLGVVRALFGLMMVFDVVHERGLQDVEERFGDPMSCHFPLFHWWSPLPFEYMGLIYFIMWIGAFGIFLGYRFKLSCISFIFPYWYIFLLDKTAWNNHSYLYGLISIIFLFTSAHNSYSMDSLFNKEQEKSRDVPLWNYWIIRFQFFLLYFYAGLKKLDPDWIGGHSMVSLSSHWVFDPFRVFLNNEQIDLWIIHVFGFFFDLTVGFWLLLDKTRPLAIIFSSSFHLMNSRMFQIGQFPYVCLVTTPIFCGYSWPRRLCRKLYTLPQDHHEKSFSAKNLDNAKAPQLHSQETTWKQKMTVCLLATYVSIQLYLPYSHNLTQGYNNWTNGLYGYSWDMMVHSWDTALITVTVKDHDTGKQHYIDPDAWVRSTRYSKHADMVVQYASCIEQNLASLAKKDGHYNKLQNISVYLDVWCSLNNRFQQRVFHPHQDMLKAEWHPFTKTPWILPLLTDLTPWREYIATLHSEVLSWHIRTDSLFIADFPGMMIEHYVRDELKNVTLTVLHGAVTVQQGKNTNTLVQGESVRVRSGRFHKVFTISKTPSCFAYTYLNDTSFEDDEDTIAPSRSFEILSGYEMRLLHFQRSLKTLWACFKKIVGNLGIYGYFGLN